MWTALFIIAIVATIGFILAAVWMSPQIPNGVLHRRNRSSLIAEFAAGCRDVSKAACAAFEPRWPIRGDTSAVGCGASDAQLPSLANSDWRVPSFATTVWRDAALFPRRMRLLHIDPDEFACAEPVICRQLAIRCERCESATQCAQDLSDDSTDPFGEDWRGYCPNASTLSTISTLRGIGISLGAGRDGAPMGNDKPSVVTSH